MLLDEFGLSLGEVAERVGKLEAGGLEPRAAARAADDVLAMVERGELTEGHARAVLAVPDHDERRRLARRIVARGTVGARRRARGAQGGRRARSERRGRAPSIPRSPRGCATAFRTLTGFEREGRAGRTRSVARRRGRRRLEELAEALERARSPRNRPAHAAPVAPVMDGTAGSDLESLEAITQDDDDAQRSCCAWRTCRWDGRLQPFLRELAARRRPRCRDEGRRCRSSPRTGRSCSPSRTTLHRTPATTALDARNASRWAILDSNQGPPPYQSGALTN